MNVMTVDVEDWYQGIELSSWEGLEPRLEIGTNRLLDLFDRTATRATFFVLGANVAAHAALIRELVARGHEVGTHGWGHEFVDRMAPVVFRRELRDSIHAVEDAAGTPVRSHRAAYFSISAGALWALEVLCEEGIRFDSSLFPIRNYRYGMPHAPRLPFQMACAAGRILEFPISTLRWAGVNLPFAGGFYLRFLPLAWFHLCTCRLNRCGEPTVAYIHSWELDPDQPRLDLPARIRLTHYHRLATTEAKLARVLRSVSFRPLERTLEDLDRAGALPTMRIDGAGFHSDAETAMSPRLRAKVR